MMVTRYSKSNTVSLGYMLSFTNCILNAVSPMSSSIFLFFKANMISTSLSFYLSIFLFLFLFYKEIRTEYRSGYISAQRVSDKSLEALIVKLDKMGFIFCRREQQKQVLMLAVTTYKSIYNDLSIPKVIWY